MIRICLCVALFGAAPAFAGSEPSPECLVAARRLTESTIVEAKGTRHEPQIAGAIAKKGGLDRAIYFSATEMDKATCAMLFTAPDSTVRALAIASLPERQGK